MRGMHLQAHQTYNYCLDHQGSDPKKDGTNCTHTRWGDCSHNWSEVEGAYSRDYGVPVSVLMATIYVESSFDSHARPPRKKILGFIPGPRASSALGYSQALDGTWAEYQARAGQRGASRTDFGDAIYFIAWYHYQSHIRNGIALNDPYNLYLAYHSGHSGYSRGVWKSRPVAKSAAARPRR